MIICCISVFNEADNIARAIESIVDYVDKIIVLDGAYARFMALNNLNFFSQMMILKK